MKPYDLEQAKKAVASATEGMIRQAADVIKQVGEERARVLEVQASAFAELPRDLSSLFRDASAVVIDEIDFSNGPAKLQAVDIRTDHDHRQINRARGYFDEGLGELPAKKHRVLVFFIPIEP